MWWPVTTDLVSKYGYMAARLRLVALALFGATLGWWALQWFHPWLQQFAAHGPIWAICARSIDLAICYVLGRAVVDVLTDLHDFMRRSDTDPLLDRLKIVDGRIPWAPTLAFVWVHMEGVVALTLLLGVLPWAAFGGGGWESAKQVAGNAERLTGARVWQDTAGVLGFGLACFSIVSRNAPPPVLPLPYRWLGLSRYLRADEVGRVKMAWSRDAGQQEPRRPDD